MTRSWGTLLDENPPGSGTSFSTIKVDSLNGFIVGTSGVLGATNIGATSPIYFENGVIGYTSDIGTTNYIWGSISATSPIFFNSGIIGFTAEYTGTSYFVRSFGASLVNPWIDSATGSSLALTSLRPTQILYSGTSNYITGSSSLTWDDTQLKVVGPIQLGLQTGTATTSILKFNRYFGAEAGTSGIANKIALFMDSSGSYGLYGFGIQSGAVSYVSAGNHLFYRGVSLVGGFQSGNFNANFNASIDGTLGVTGVVSAYSTLAATNVTTAALVIRGGVGVGDGMYVANTINIAGLTALSLVATDSSKNLISTNGVSFSPVFASLAISSLTPTTVLYAGTSGYVTGSSNVTWDGSTLKVFGDVFAASGWLQTTNLTDTKVMVGGRVGLTMLVAKGASAHSYIVSTVNSGDDSPFNLGGNLLLGSRSGVGSIFLRTNMDRNYDLSVGLSGQIFIPFRLGVGATNAIQQIHIMNTGTGTTLGQLPTNIRLETRTGTVGSGSEISFMGSLASGIDQSTLTYAAISAPIVANAPATGARGDIVISTKAGSADATLTERFRVGQSGIITQTSGRVLTTISSTRQHLIQDANPILSISGITTDAGLRLAAGGASNYAYIEFFRTRLSGVSLGGAFIRALSQDTGNDALLEIGVQTNVGFNSGVSLQSIIQIPGSAGNHVWQRATGQTGINFLRATAASAYNVLNFQQLNGSSTITTISRIISQGTSLTAAAENSNLYIDTMKGGSLTNYVMFNGYTGSIDIPTGIWPVITTTTDGERLMHFKTDRGWFLEQEGTGAATHLRLRNTGGPNKNIYIDTTGGQVIGRDVTGVTTYWSLTNTRFNVNGGSGTNRGYQINTDDVARWALLAGSTAEGATNTGSPFVINAIDDAGSYIDSVMHVFRASGGTFSINRPLHVGSSARVLGSLGVSGGLNVSLGATINTSLTVGATSHFLMNVRVGQTNTVSTQVVIDGASGNFRRLRYETGSVLRWLIGASEHTESGGDVGSNFLFQAWTDAGAFIDNAILIARSSTATPRTVWNGSVCFTKNIAVATTSSVEPSTNLDVYGKVNYTSKDLKYAHGDIQEDFYTGYAALPIYKYGWTFSEYNNGTWTQNNTLVSANHHGILELSTGGDPTDGADAEADITLYNFSARPFLLGGGALSYRTEIYFATLSTAAQEYESYIGFMDNTPLLGTTGDPANGVYFKYRRATNANWICMSMDNSTGSSTITSIGVTNGAWIELRADINAAATAVTFLINGSAVGSLTTNIPTASTRTVGPGFRIRKTAGTNARTMNVDYWESGNRFKTAR